MQTPKHKHNNAGDSVPHPSKSGLPRTQWSPAGHYPAVNLKPQLAAAWRNRQGGHRKTTNTQATHHAYRHDGTASGTTALRVPTAHRLAEDGSPRWEGQGEGWGQREASGRLRGGDYDGGFAGVLQTRPIRTCARVSPPNKAITTRAIVTEPKLGDGSTRGCHALSEKRPAPLCTRHATPRREGKARLTHPLIGTRQKRERAEKPRTRGSHCAAASRGKNNLGHPRRKVLPEPANSVRPPLPPGPRGCWGLRVRGRWGAGAKGGCEGGGLPGGRAKGAGGVGARGWEGPRERVGDWDSAGRGGRGVGRCGSGGWERGSGRRL